MYVSKCISNVSSTHISGLLRGEDEVGKVDVYHVESRTDGDGLFGNIFPMPLSQGRADVRILENNQTKVNTQLLRGRNNKTGFVQLIQTRRFVLAGNEEYYANCQMAKVQK